MKILRLYPFIPPCRGGIEMHVSNLCTQQRLMGHDVTLFYNQGFAAHLQDFQIVRSLSLRRIKPQIIRDLIFYTCALFECLKNNQRPDIVHVHGDLSAFFFGALLSIFLRPRTCVASIHSEIRGGIRRRFYRSALARYSVVYCTGFRESKLLQSYGIKNARWQPSGVSPEFAQLVKTAVVGPIVLDVICVANLVPVKNLKLLIEVAQRLPQYSFEVVGDGPLQENLQLTCKSLGVQNLNFSGNLNRGELAARLSSARIFYLPSLTEGTPTAMMEAMMMGLPVVLTPSNEYQDIVREGINGYVTNDFSVEGSVQAIEKLLTNHLLMTGMSTQNRADAERFAWSSVARRITGWMQEDMGI